MLPFGHPLGTLGAQMPLLGRFGDTLFFHVFGRVLMLTFTQNGSQNGAHPPNFLAPFWYLFPEGTPSVKSTLKVTFFIKNTIVTSCFLHYFLGVQGDIYMRKI